MPTSVTPLTGRSQTMVSAVLTMMAVMGVTPFFEIWARRTPLRFGEVPWRYDTFLLLLDNGPPLVILLGVIGLFGVIVGHRRAVRSVAIALGIIVVVHVILAPLLLLDYLQVRISSDRPGGLVSVVSPSRRC